MRKPKASNRVAAVSCGGIFQRLHDFFAYEVGPRHYAGAATLGGFPPVINSKVRLICRQCGEIRKVE